MTETSDLPRAAPMATLWIRTPTLDEVEDGDAPVDGDDDGRRRRHRRRTPPAATAERRADLFRQSEIAADYVEGLLDILDYDGDIDELVSGGRPVVEVVGDGGRRLRRWSASAAPRWRRCRS